MNVQELAQLARESESDDPIDWGMIPVREDEAYMRMAEQVIEMMKGYNVVDRQNVSLIAITKLLVENFVLNYQLANGLSKAV